MYNSTFICTYNYYDISIAIMNPLSKKLLEDIPNLHDESKEELLEMAHMLYQNELLSAFNLTSFDEKVINIKINELFEVVFKNKNENNNILQLEEIIKSLTKKMLVEDLETGFIMLFSYSYFHLTHLCLCEYFNIGKISQEKINALKNCL